MGVQKSGKDLPSTTFPPEAAHACPDLGSLTYQLEDEVCLSQQVLLDIKDATLVCLGISPTENQMIHLRCKNNHTFRHQGSLNARMGEEGAWQMFFSKSPCSGVSRRKLGIASGPKDP